MTTTEPTPGGGAEPGYDPAAVAKGLRAIDGATAEVRSLLATIASEVDALGATWRARLNVAFTQVHLRRAERAALIDNALQTMHTTLAATDVTYAKTAQAQVDQYQAIANSS